MIKPIQKRLLIELKGEYENISTSDPQFGKTKSRGLVRGIAKDIEAECAKLELKIDSVVYFDKFEDNAPVVINGKPGCLLKLEEIGGVDNG